MKKYEAMILFNPAVATDWDKMKAEVDRLMERAEAKVLACGKWDERRLAFEIRGIKRAVYVLVYFEADSSRIGSIERDANLEESILRMLIVRADHVTDEMMKEAMTSADARPAPEPGAGGPREEGAEPPSRPARPPARPVAAAADSAPDPVAPAAEE